MIQKMINFNDVTKDKIKVDNPNWSQIPDQPCMIWIIGGSISASITQTLIKFIYMLKIQIK